MALVTHVCFLVTLPLLLPQMTNLTAPSDSNKQGLSCVLFTYWWLHVKTSLHSTTPKLWYANQRLAMDVNFCDHNQFLADCSGLKSQNEAGEDNYGTIVDDCSRCMR